MASGEFTIFGKFPPELRDRIWETAVAASEPGAVAIYIKEGVFEYRGIPSEQVKLKATSVMPTRLLQTTRESRAVALRSYKLEFQSFLGDAPVYFNSKIDTVYFHDEVTFAAASGGSWDERGMGGPSLNIQWQLDLRHVAINSNVLEPHWARVVESLWGLETLQLLSDDQEDDSTLSPTVDDLNYTTRADLKMVWTDFKGEEFTNFPVITFRREFENLIDLSEGWVDIDESAEISENMVRDLVTST